MKYLNHYLFRTTQKKLISKIEEHNKKVEEKFKKRLELFPQRVQNAIQPPSAPTPPQPLPSSHKVSNLGTPPPPIAGQGAGPSAGSQGNAGPTRRRSSSDTGPRGMRANDQQQKQIDGLSGLFQGEQKTSKEPPEKIPE